MKTHDVIIVGAGPAGASCAGELFRNGVDCLILDRAPFPRPKLCAGWVTPAVLSDLDCDEGSYPHRLITFERIHVHMHRMHFKLNSRQHSIRRFEFDDWLLRRSGALAENHYVKTIRFDDGYYIIDDTYRARYLVGAGGTKCPVYRHLFRAANPRAKELQAVTLEQEFAFDWTDPECHLWFFDHRLPGYSWYVPKQNGYLNIGVGGMAGTLKQRNDDVKRQWSSFIADLRRAGMIGDLELEPGGYSYYLRTAVDTIRIANAMIIGDSVGLATRDLCEGIGPAVRTGLLAAKAICDPNIDYSLESVDRYSLGKGLMAKFLEYRIVKGRSRGGKAGPQRSAAA